MTTHHHDQSSQQTGTWLLAVFGALAVAALIAAMVWVVQGQMQQAQVLRNQWHATRAEPGRDAASGQVGSVTKPPRGNGVIAVSFDRP